LVFCVFGWWLILENFGLFLLLGARVLRGLVGFVDFGCFLRAGFLCENGVSLLRFGCFVVEYGVEPFLGLVRSWFVGLVFFCLIL